MNAPLEPDDPSSLIRVIAERRDQAAFARLFSTMAPRIKAYIMRLGAPPEAAEEIAQETMLTVWRKADRFDPARATGAAWIFAIARNLRIDVIRRDGGVVLVDDQSIEESSEPAIADSLIAAALRWRHCRRSRAT
jgi:RNA polymerase sigma-70 factor (ECF subfamily)